MFFFDGSGEGERADQVRKWGVPIVGGGSFCDKLEKDRMFGFEMAEQAGAQLRPHEQYNTLTESEAAAPDGEVYFKSDRYLAADATKGLKDKEHLHQYFEGLKREHGDNIKHILQEKIEGVPLSTARWWNGSRFVGPYETTYEHKAFMDGDVGGSTGCSFNAIFFHPNDPQIAEDLGWERLTLAFRRNEAPPGLYDINAVVAEDGQVYFLEWTPRLGYDSEMTSFRLMPNLGEHLFAMAEGREMPAVSGDLAYTVRLTVPPYPWEYGKLDHKGTCAGKLVRGNDGLWDKKFIAYQVRQDPETGLTLAGPEGLVGLSYAQGGKLKAISEEALDYAKELHKTGEPSALQFRTDGGSRIAEDAKKVRDAGHEIHKGLLQ